MNNDLLQQLRDGGHTEQADQLRDRGLAAELREAGRDDLAAQLEGEAAPAELKPPKQRTADRGHGEAVAHVLERDTGRTFREDAA